MEDTSSNENEEEANLCLMKDTTSEEFESDQEDEVNLNDQVFSSYKLFKTECQVKFYGLIFSWI